MGSGLFRYEKKIVDLLNSTTLYTLHNYSMHILPWTQSKVSTQGFPFTGEDTNLVSLNPVLENQDQDSNEEDSNDSNSVSN
jgi:hypothetical protein